MIVEFIGFFNSNSTLSQSGTINNGPDVFPLVSVESILSVPNCSDAETILPTLPSVNRTLHPFNLEISSISSNPLITPPFMTEPTLINPVLSIDQEPWVDSRPHPIWILLNNPELLSEPYFT